MRGLRRFPTGHAAILSACLVTFVACTPTERDDVLELPAIEWNPRSYDCVRVDSPPTIDGVLDDEAWRSARWSEAFVDIRGEHRAPPRHPTRVRMVWDAEHLYVGAWLEEPDVWATLVERDSVIYHDNDFEMFLDPDGDTHDYLELEINALGTEWDLRLTRPYRDDGDAIDEWDLAGLRTAIGVDGTLNRPGDVDRGWGVEIAIPWAGLDPHAGRSLPPRHGDLWRMNFSRVQWRTEVRDGRYAKLLGPDGELPLPEDNWVWSPQGLINMHYPEMWGFVRFVDDEDVPEFSVPADERVRWALRQVYYRQRESLAARGRFLDDADRLGLGSPPPTTGAEPPWRSWPPEIVSDGETFEAVLQTREGRELRIGEDGRAR